MLCGFPIADAVVVVIIVASAMGLVLTSPGVIGLK
jgi:hypothetical protein|tara:strand:+ start:463 stop:567 length:105 start_codon:yes stop_codon:yes gene_type:complete